MNIKKRLLSLTAVAGLTVGTLVVGMGAAQAAPSLGELRIAPATGTTDSGLSASTLSGTACPAGASGVTVDLSGSGIAAGNGLLQGFTPYGSVQGPDGNVVVGAIANPFRQVFADNNVASPSGAYTVRIACIGSDFFTETGEFTQVVNFTPTGGAQNATYTAVVPAQSTTTVLSQNAASSNFGSSVTFTADVTDGAAGSVQFKDGATNLGAPQAVNATGIASFTTSTLAVGAHTISAEFVPSGTGFNGSTSNTVTHTVNAVATSMSLISNGTSSYGQPAVFTATVTPNAAGNVTFSEGATTLGTRPVDASGQAVLSVNTLAVGTHSVTAHFTPSGSGATPADAGPIDHIVVNAAIAPVVQNIVVQVPAGALTIVLDDGADGNVDLGTAQMNAAGDFLTASGAMDIVKVTDTRAGDPGWTASGIVTDFSNGTDAINGFNLGWVPSIVSSSANQVGIAAGPTVAAGTEPTAISTPLDPNTGLEATRTLAIALDNAGNGTARLGAALSLNIPTDVSAGQYAATLTLTVA